MRALATAVAVTAVLLSAAPASAAYKARFCGTHTYASGQTLLLFASTGVKCQFARKNGRAVYLRKRCAKGWKYSRRKPNPAG
ncbi:MAG: hypothetical protein QOI64_514, partial [Solirubrobacteraceae bacterium]|nr:hypothetical protein [Solirubrobacteraceae bacterium]